MLSNTEPTWHPYPRVEEMRYHLSCICKLDPSRLNVHVCELRIAIAVVRRGRHSFWKVEVVVVLLWRGGLRKVLIVWEVGMLVQSMGDFRGVWLVKFL
jgi:hypothetical protein